MTTQVTLSNGDIWSYTGAGNYSGAPGGYFGCSCGMITSLSAPSFLPVKPIKNRTLPSGEVHQECLAKADTDEHFRYVYDKHTLNNDYTLIIMSGLVNPDKIPAAHIHGRWAVAGFVEWLIKKGEYIIATPVLTNQQHNTPKAKPAGTAPGCSGASYDISADFSLRRGWFWLPNTGRYKTMHIADSGYVANPPKPNQGNFLSFDKWLNEKYKDLPKFDLTELRG